MATAYIYHYATGKWEENTSNIPLIGYYADNIWWNDLWLCFGDTSQSSDTYKKINSVNLTIDLEKLLIIDKDKANPMEITMGIYQQLPSVVANKFTRYTLDDIRENLIEEINTDTQDGQSFTINKHLSLSLNCYVSSQYYIHLYINNKDNNGRYSNNAIKAYCNELAINFEQNQNQDKTYSKATYTAHKYGYNSNYIEETVIKDVYYSDYAPQAKEIFPYVSDGYIYIYDERENENNVWDIHQQFNSDLKINNKSSNDESHNLNDESLTLGENYTVSLNTKSDYIFNYWEINGESYGNQPKLTFTLTPEMVDFSGESPTFTLTANKTPKVYIIAIPALSAVYSFTCEDERLRWPNLTVENNELLLGWRLEGWKDTNNNIYSAEGVMPLQSMIVEPDIVKNSEIFTADIPYNPSGYYTLAPLIDGNESEEIYAYTTGMQIDLETGKTKPAGPVYSIYEVMDTATFNSRFQGIDELHPLTHEKIAGNPLTIFQNDKSGWGSEQNGYLYQKTEKGVWRRVN